MQAFTSTEVAFSKMLSANAGESMLQANVHGAPKNDELANDLVADYRYVIGLELRMYQTDEFYGINERSYQNRLPIVSIQNRNFPARLL